MKRWILTIVIWLFVNLLGSIFLMLLVLPLYFKHPDEPIEIVFSFEAFLFIYGYSLALSIPALIVYMIIILSVKLPHSLFLKKSFGIISILIFITFIFLSLIGQNILYGLIFFLPFSLTYILAVWIIIRILKYYHFNRIQDVPN